MGAANLSGSNSGDVTIVTANGLSLSAQALSLAAATNSIPGAVTAAQVTAIEANTQSLVDTQIHGFVDNTETTISFSTYTFTLTDAGAGWSYYRDGIKYTISGNQTTVLSGTPPSTDTYYIVIDAIDGTLTNSTTEWNLTDSKVPVAAIHFNANDTPSYTMLDERHTATMNKNQHHYEHDTYGTRLGSSGAISGYTLGSDVDINKQFDIAETKIWDEDLKTTLAAITGGTDNYHIAYRTGASTWRWKQLTMPFSWTSSGYIQYDNAGTMTQGANNKYYTTYLIATNQIGLARFTIIHGQSEFNNLTAARAEQFSDLTLTGLDIAEGVAIWKFIWDTSSAYSSTGKCELDVDPIAVNTNIVTQPVTPGLGTMSTQDADDVLITGGKITLTDSLNTAYATVASHATTSAIWAAAGNIINFTGTETITDFPAADQAGAQRTLICAGAVVFTHAGNITVQGGVTYTASANDKVIVTAISTTTFHVNILPQDGLPVASASVLKTYLGIDYSTQIGAGGMIPSTTNGPASATWEYGTNDIDLNILAFDGGAIEERAQFTTIMPADWDRSTVKIKFYWTNASGASAGDTVEWGIKAGAISNGDPIDSTLGTAVTISDTLIADAYLQITSATAVMTVGGTPALGDMIQFEVYRNTDGTDDMTEDAWLLSVLIQYKKTNVVAGW